MFNYPEFTKHLFMKNLFLFMFAFTAGMMSFGQDNFTFTPVHPKPVLIPAFFGLKPGGFELWPGKTIFVDRFGTPYALACR